MDDPEADFQFASDGAGVNLWFRDWQNRQITFRFRMVYAFEYCLADERYGLCGGEAIEIIDSERIAALRQTGALTHEEDVHHYLVSTNEEEWCEVLAEGIEIQTME